MIKEFEVTLTKIIMAKDESDAVIKFQDLVSNNDYDVEEIDVLPLQEED